MTSGLTYCVIVVHIEKENMQVNYAKDAGIDNNNLNLRKNYNNGEESSKQL